MDALVGAVKIKDGLFSGDELAAQDLEFVVSNKVTHIINCSGREIANHWESIGVLYRTYYWADTDTQVLLDVRDAVVSEVFAFIEEALDRGESALVHSARGQSRAVTVLLAYMMRKYRWALSKTLQFMESRRPISDLRPAFHRQLVAFERRLAASLAAADPARFAKGPPTRGFVLSAEWADVSAFSGEELVLVNTFNNAELRPGKDVKFIPAVSASSRPSGGRRLVWNEKLEIEASPISDVHAPLKPILKLPQGVPSRRPSQQPPMFGVPPPPASPAPNSARPSSPFRGTSPRISDLLGLTGASVSSAPAPPPVAMVRPPSPAPERPQPIRQLISSIRGGPVRVLPSNGIPSRPFSAQPQLQAPSGSYASQLPSRAPMRASSPVVSSVRPPFSSTRPPTPPIHRENFQSQTPTPSSFKSPLVPTLRPRTAAGIVRRAPSPTPAFNKLPLSSAAEKQRWRT